MPKTLEKARKAIAKKRGGAIEALHAKSRDSRRLHKAQVRDDRLEKMSEARRKRDQPLITRIAFFQEATRENENKPLELSAIQKKIAEFCHQHDEEYHEMKKARRQGRPPSAREDLLRMKMEALHKEERDGFYLPDLTNEKTTEMLDRWDGNWAFLTNLTWVKIQSSGRSAPASFPPQTN
ncbi:hypothetical protein GE21DRAFT_10132 [Neurospora crassa]|nr:hypothetical protein GE21DRAFT_10132 [Neurospora crassa]